MSAAVFKSSKQAARFHITLIAALGLALSCYGCLISLRANHLRQHHEFEEGAQEKSNALAEAFDESLNTVLSVEALYKSSKQVDKDEFQDFVSHLLKKNSAIAQAVEWIAAVSREERESFVQSAKANDSGDFQIKDLTDEDKLLFSPSPDRNLYYVILFAMPEALNSAMIGLDLNSKPLRLAALQESAAYGKLHMSSVFALARRGQSPAFQISVPVYDRPSDPESNRGELRGFIAGLFVIEDLVKASNEGRAFSKDALAVQIQDVTFPEEPVSFYESPDFSKARGSALIEHFYQQFYCERTLEVAGRKLRILIKPSTVWIKRMRMWEPWIILGGGICGTILLILYLATLSGYAEKVKAAVKKRTLELAETLAAARQSEEKFRLLASHAPVGIFMTDAQGGIIFANEKLQSMSGLIGKGILGQAWKQCVHPQDRERVIRLWENSLRSRQEFHSEYRFVKPDGQILWLKGAAVPFINAKGDATGFMGTVIDATAHKLYQDQLGEANKRLMQSESKIRSLISNLPGAVYRCRCDKEWTMEFISEAIYEITGYPFSDFTKGIRSWASIIHPEDRDMVEQTVMEGVRAKRPFILEYRIQHADGTLRWVYEKGQALLSESGDVESLDGFILDITQKKILSMQLLQSQKIEAIGKLAGGIAHDYNNQMMVIHGYCDFLIGDLPPDSPMRGQVEEIKKAAERSSNITKQLLAFGRRQFVEPKLMNPNQHIQDLQKLMSSALGEGVHLQLNLTPDLKPVKMDPTQFEQVIVNLAVNARDAMPGGGVFEITTSNQRVEDDDNGRPIPGIASGNYCKIVVRDTGTGMPPEVLSHVFEPFFTTKEKGKGTGLGLASCYGIVRAANGHIQVESKWGQGTTITIYLPASAELKSSETKNLAGMKTELPRGTESILLVEDEDSVRRVAARLLLNQGYEVVEAGSAVEALSLLQGKLKDAKFDLLLTDVVMPNMTGRELADQFRILRPQAKILFMSGYTDDVIVHHGVLEAQINFIQKPFSPAALARKVREVLDHQPYHEGAA